MTNHKNRVDMICDITSDNVELLVLLFGPERIEKMDISDINKNEYHVLKTYICDKLSQYKKYKKTIRQMIDYNSFDLDKINNCEELHIMFGFYLLAYCNGLGIGNMSDATKNIFVTWFNGLNIVEKITSTWVIHDRHMIKYGFEPIIIQHQMAYFYYIIKYNAHIPDLTMEYISRQVSPERKSARKI